MVTSVDESRPGDREAIIETVRMEHFWRDRPDELGDDRPDLLAPFYAAADRWLADG